jgi:Leucine-rich repeat (LRR) protein
MYPNVFNELTNLQDLDVCNNKIKVIHETTFNGLTNLNQIDFSENQIKKIHQNKFFFINNFYIYIYIFKYF